MADTPRLDYGIGPEGPWPRTSDGSYTPTQDGPDSSGIIIRQWESITTDVSSDHITSSERELAKALQDCKTGHNNAPMVCHGCINVFSKDKFPGVPNIKEDDCSKCYRNQHAPTISANGTHEDLYITEYSEQRLLHKFATETIPKIKAQMRIEIAKELSEEKSEDNRIMNRNILSKTIRRN